MKMLVIFNHELTDKQRQDAVKSLTISEFVVLPDKLKKVMSGIDPGVVFPIRTALKLINWINKTSSDGDYVLVQGDFGITFYIVDWCFNNNRIPVYTTTKRVYKGKDREDGSVSNVHIFKHVRFRKYKKV